MKLHFTQSFQQQHFERPIRQENGSTEMHRKLLLRLIVDKRLTLSKQQKSMKNKIKREEERR